MLSSVQFPDAALVITNEVSPEAWWTGRTRVPVVVRSRRAGSRKESGKSTVELSPATQEVPPDEEVEPPLVEEDDEDDDAPPVDEEDDEAAPLDEDEDEAPLSDGPEQCRQRKMGTPARARVR